MVGAGIDIPQLYDQALSDPARSLVELWTALAASYGELQSLIRTASRDPSRHALVAKTIATSLKRQHETCQIEAEDRLALLRALDEAAALHASGHPATHRRIGDHWLQRRPVRAHPKSRQQAGSLQHWAPHHWVFPAHHEGIEITVRGRGLVALESDLEHLAAADSLRIHLGAFNDGVKPNWLHPAPRYGCRDLTDPNRRWTSVREALEQAARDEAEIVLLPELTVTPHLRERTQEWLATNEHPIVICVPGSFHEEHGGKPRNVALAFDKHGEEILTHLKLCPMRTSNDDEVDEDIEGAAHIELVATPLGLFALGICLDYCQLLHPFTDFWQRIGPGLVLVPSMGNPSTGRAHLDRSNKLAIDHDTLSAVATQPDPPPGPATCLGFVRHGTGAQGVVELSHDPVLPWSRTLTVPLK